MKARIVSGLRPLAVRISTLNPDPANARTHDARNLEAVRASLAKFGQRKPVVVQRDGMVVRAGNATLAAAKDLGWTELAAVVVDEEDLQATAFAIADNRTAELAGWDDDVLAQLLGSLAGDSSIDATLTGFSAAEIERLARPAGDAAAVDEIPEPPRKPVSRLGDVWLLGRHRLVCGDATDALVVRRALRGDEPRLLLTDPPYGVELDMEWRDRAGMNDLAPAAASYMRKHRTNSEISGDTRADWSQAFELAPSLDTAYVWHASAFAIEVGAGLRRIGFELKQQIIWRKPHFALSRQHYHWQHEPCWYARKAGSLKFRGSRDQSTVWDAASPKMLMTGSGEEKVDHPTQKPASLYVRPIENHLARGEVFYEPFGGSGTAIAAAEQTGRRCVAIELDPKYCDVIVERWQALTGGKARRKSAATSGAASSGRRRNRRSRPDSRPRCKSGTRSASGSRRRTPPTSGSVSP